MNAANHDYTRSWLASAPENFPVASWLLPARLRAGVLALYGFARGADEIADDGGAPADSRRKALLTLDSALSRGDVGGLPLWARAFGEQVRLHPALHGLGRDLLSAFLQDTVKTRYATEEELLDYCRRSAAPIGRAILVLAGEKTADLEAADALCHALQLLNHGQDCGKDYLRLNRVYLPAAWLDRPEMLAERRSSPQVREALDRLLGLTERLISASRPLPATIRGFRLRLEIKSIREMAVGLCAKLRVQDPLAGRVSLTRREKLACCLRALWTR